MAFLDNSGDIILDVVLTDHGRKVLAKGDGSFQITKFAVGDEEIDYSLYNPAHASGSAYYDLEILQTPILEAFTNNASSMKTKLVSYQNMSLLYLPTLKLNENLNDTRRHSDGVFIVAVDRESEGTDGSNGTANAIGMNSSGQHVNGVLFGESFESSNSIRVDQGIASNEISPKQSSLMDGLTEDVYILQIDNRLGRIVDMNGNTIAEDYIDDDNIAFYSISETTGLITNNSDDTSSSTQVIEGPRGSILQFKIAASLDLQTSTFLFTQLGSQTNMNRKSDGALTPVRFIDTIVRATGMVTGYTIDIPVRFVKTIT